MVPAGSKHPNLPSAFFLFAWVFLELLFQDTPPPPPAPPSSGAISRRDGSAIRNSSTPEVCASDLSQFRSSCFKVFEPYCKSCIVTENLPYWHSATTTCQTATPHAMDSNIPPQLEVFVWIPRNRKIRPSADLKQFFRSHGI